MKTNFSIFRKFTALSFVVFAVLFTSCEDKDSCKDLSGGTSLYELNKSIIELNVTAAATGLRAVFKDEATDSTGLAKLSRAFVEKAVFFEDKSGYFFIETLEDALVVAHINEDWIGTSRINAEDANGKKHVQEIINTVNYTGYGYVEYAITNPASGAVEDKLSFVTGITPPGWFIGTGIYNYGKDEHYEVNEANKILVKEVTQTMAKGISGVFEKIYPDNKVGRDNFSRTFLDHIRFFDDHSGYFFIIDAKDGVSIAHGADQSLEGTSLLELIDSKGTYITKGLIEVANANEEGGYFEYYFKNPSTEEENHKVSFVQKIPGTDYIIGTGVYQD